MSKGNELTRQDRLLGVGSPIARRDFVGSTLVGAGAALLAGCAPAQMLREAASAAGYDPWTGYGGVGDYASSNGNTKAVMDAAHLVRDGRKQELVAAARPTGEIFDLAVVGGGFSGLAAAYQFQAKAGGKTCLILENHPVFGGEAKENEFRVRGHRLFGPQGSNGFLPPPGRDTLSDDIWREVGMPMEYRFADAHEDFGLKTAHDSYDAMFWGERNLDVGHLFRGANGALRWERNIWSDDLARTPWSPRLRRDMLRAFTGRETAHENEGLGPWLDSMTYQDYLEKELGCDPGVAQYLDPILAIADYAFSCDVISAYGAYLIQMPGMRGYFQADTMNFEAVKIMSFPGGNGAYARHIAKRLIPGAILGESFEDIVHGRIDFAALDRPGAPTRLRLNASVVDVRQAGPGVELVYVRNGRPEKVAAKCAVLAAGGWAARRTVSNMPEAIQAAYRQFHHGPVLVANVALDNWRFLERLGFAAARWHEGFGFFGSIRAPMQVGGKMAPFHPDQPMVMTFYVPFHRRGQPIEVQGIVGRAELLSKSYLDYEREIRAHMTELFAPGGFDARRDIAGIVLNRWGHAYIAPQPGFYFGGPDGAGLAAPIKQGHDRIFYGHSELGARMNYRNAIAEGGRAGEQAARRLAG